MRIILVAAFPIAVRDHERGCLKTPVLGKANAQRVGMRREIRAHYDHLDLLPQALEDWVPQNHPAGFIREFVDALDVVGCDFDGGRVKGGGNYAPGLLLEVRLYGYMARIRSTWKPERACREHLSLLSLTLRHMPHHNTLPSVPVGILQHLQPRPVPVLQRWL